MAKVSLILACIAAVVVAEPPVPQGQYPPSSQFGTPSGQFGLSGQYGVPDRFGGGRAPQAGYPSGPNGNGNGGLSASGYGGEGEDGNSEPANYEFKYDVENQESGVKLGHEEEREGDVAQGKYYVLLPDGRTQLVEYVADQDGYRPKISYEDPQDQAGYSSGGPNGQGGYPSGGPSGQIGYSNGGASGHSSAGPGQGGYAHGGAGGYSK